MNGMMINDEQRSERELESGGQQLDKRFPTVHRLDVPAPVPISLVDILPGI